MTNEDMKQNLTYLNENFSDGGEKELEQMIDWFGAPLFRYCHTIIRDYHEAQDITQNVLIKAYQNRHTFIKGSSLSAWLYKIAYRTCIDHLRRRKLPFIADGKKSFRNDGPEQIRDEGLSEGMLIALGRLTPKERAVVYGRIIEEQSYCELAAICHCSETALRKRYERAKKKLVTALTEQRAAEKPQNSPFPIGCNGEDNG